MVATCVHLLAAAQCKLVDAARGAGRTRCEAGPVRPYEAGGIGAGKAHAARGTRRVRCYHARCEAQGRTAGARGARRVCLVRMDGREHYY